MKTVVGLFDELSEARILVEDLANSGFDRDDISLVARDLDGTYATELETSRETAVIAEGATTGAVTGGVVGSIGGVLLGLGALAIPGVGPVIAAGPIVAGITGAVAGAVAGGLIGGLIAWGIPEEEAGYYAEGVRRGGTLVALKVDEANVNKAVNIMERHDPVDISRRSAFWRAAGWNGYDPEAAPYDSEGYRQELVRYRDFDDDGYNQYRDAFQRHYQRTFANKGYGFERYEPGYRYGYKLATDEHYRDRSSWDELKDEARQGWEEFEETADYAWDEFKASVRHAWEAVKDAFDADDDYQNGTEPSLDTDTVRAFRTHYDTYYLNSPYGFTIYRPAYAYGYTMANEYRDRNLTWDAAHPELRRRWEADNDGLWEDFKDSVEYGWNRFKQAIS
ncbi:MAG: hypothetical protein KDE09_02405 [Anaerolineales bacterium]|nr:hypothetical protein [Anaerolineales bacterium]